MNCPKCGNPAPSRRRTCDVCGCDLTVYRKIIRLSNGFYNRGLEQAKVRDLTGAVGSLKKSLEINKRNIDARNLLGLVYYEMGETVAALSEWVISKNFKPEDNDADYFMERVQDNPTELDTMNQAVRKYNLALDAARQGNEDLAIIQLKKVVSMQGNFLRAIHLLALLYIKTGEPEKARKYLKKALRIDVSNTTTLRYLAEVERDDVPDQEDASVDYWNRREDKDDSGKGIAVRSSYREDRPNIMVFVNLLIGVVIGIAVVYFLIVPTIKTNIKEEYESKKVDYSAELSSKSATITQQEKKIASLEKQVQDLQAELEGIDTTPVQVEVGAEIYTEFFEVWSKYNTLMHSDYSDDDLQSLALELWSVDENQIASEYAHELLQEMRDDIYPMAARMIYKSGKALYDSGDFASAAGMLEAAVDFNPESDTAMYYLGKSLQALEQYEEAAYYYKLMLEVCPNSTLKQYIPQRLKECGVGE